MARGREEIRIDVTAGDEPRPEPRAVRTDTGGPFTILVLGDFRGADVGAPAHELPPVSQRTPLAVDRDDLDAMVSAVGPAVRVPGDGGLPDQLLTFESMEDFHPDRLLRRSPLLAALREERGRVERGEGVAGDETDPGDVAPGEGAASGEEGQGSVLDRILGETAGGGSNGRPPSGGRGPQGAGAEGALDDPLEASRHLEEFLRRITRPHETEGPDPERDAQLEALDRETVEQLRGILHHPRFQALEARWAALSFLVHGLETGPDLKVYGVQASRSELVEGARTGEVGRLLDRSAHDLLQGGGWTMVVVDHAFRGREDEIRALEALAGVGRERGTAIVAEADAGLLGLDPGLAGEEDDDDGGTDEGPSREALAAWKAVRGHPGAAHLALLLPRFLVRLPYGPNESPVDALDFHEFTPGRPADPGHLLWAHPGVLLALLLGRAFTRGGWGFEAGVGDRVERLPLGLHRGEEGVTALPTTELVLDAGDARSLAEAGFLPVMARPGETDARFPFLRSLAASGASLHGPWAR